MYVGGLYKIKYGTVPTEEPTGRWEVRPSKVNPKSRLLVAPDGHITHIGSASEVRDIARRNNTVTV